MIREALELIQKTARDADAARVIVELSGDGRKAFVQQGAEIKAFDIPPAVRNHKVASLADLICYMQSPPASHPVVWHNPLGVVLVLDDADRRDRVAFELTLSERFSMLKRLAKEKPALDQKAFVRLLRIQLGLDATIVGKFRKVDFAAAAESSGEINHGSDKLGKTITAKVNNIAEIPDELNISVPVYQQTGEREEYLVRCAVEIDTQNRMFQLIPMPDELERVTDLAQASIHSRLQDAASKTASANPEAQREVIPVYYGAP